jgi:radical SAM superfamily enzyme YgiQ (UPF0313 family)
VQRLVSLRPALVAISALTASINEAYALSAALRTEGIRVVLGGLHVTACAEEARRHADAIVVGDGEPVWGRVLDDAESGKLGAGAVVAAAEGLGALYRADGSFNLAHAPLPRFELAAAVRRPRFTVHTERGCPFACDFCGASRLLGKFREKPVEVIERELAVLCELQPRPVIELADDNTFAGRRDAAALLKALERSGVRYFTECDWRIGERPEILEQLAASGCVQVLVGIETLRPRHAGMGAKAAPLPRVMEALERVQESGVPVIGCFVVGGDGEDFESMAELQAFLLEAPLADVQLTVQTPFPGTGLHARLAREGRLLPERGWNAHTLFDVTYRPDRLSVDELERGFVNLVKCVFSEGPARRRAEIRRRIMGRAGRGAALRKARAGA